MGVTTAPDRIGPDRAGITVGLSQGPDPLDADDLPQHLSQIETRWSMVFQAHEDEVDAALAAQRQLMERYGGAVHRYLLSITRDPEAAADLAQDFAVRFLRGDFRRANPRRGRFRDFVKTAVMNLAIDAHRRRKRTRPRSLPDDGLDPAAPPEEPADLDQQFYKCWRDELLNCAWEGLAKHEQQTGQPYHTVLRFRAANPELRSPEMAERLTALLGKPVNAGWVRQALHRARERFVELLLEEVAHSLGTPTEDEIDDELLNLDLWSYCRPARERRPKGT